MAKTKTATYYLVNEDKDTVVDIVVGGRAAYEKMLSQAKIETEDSHDRFTVCRVVAEVEAINETKVTEYPEK